MAARERDAHEATLHEYLQVELRGVARCAT